ncbi:MAG: NDP-sugar synthase [Elusimicrobia bacterium]|nr:NDP-sugar synthase [Elusimicrobiota bacterium]
MKALLLIGGQGTRLRPFTCATPKPLLPVVNRPFFQYQFDILRRHGIREAVLCTSYRPQDFRRAVAGGKVSGVRVRFAHERSPLGTGGALRNAASFVRGTTLVLNGDILNTLDIGAFLRAHRRARADASIALTRVKDPTLYGLVETDEGGLIRRFLEKPSWDEITCNTINAGAYLFEPEVVELIPPGVPYSLERGLFPMLLQKGRRLLGFVTPGYWIDIGTVEKYLHVHLDILGGRTPFQAGGGSKRGAFRLGRGARLGRDVSHDGLGTVVLGARSTLGRFVRLGGSVSIGSDCAVGQGASLDDCVVLDGTRIGEGAQLKRCVVGRRCRIGPHALLGPGRALGDGSLLAGFSQL